MVQEVDRDGLIRQYSERQRENDDRIRELVIKYRRVDVLAKEVLNYEVQPFHLAMMLHAARNKDSLHLAFRGSGKSTIITVCGAIFDMIVDPNVRICIASETQGHAADILREIKAHLEGNDTFRRIFGDLVGSVWNLEEIIISTRDKAKKEPTIMAVGVGGQVVGKHFDRVYADDIVLEENARTEVMREKLKIWWYKSFKPTFEPHCRVKVIGTRYHFADLYGHFQANEFAECTQIIKALEKRGGKWVTPWPAKFSVQYFLDWWAGSGTIIFNSQMQCDTEAMKGEIFSYDWMDEIGEEDVPDDIVGYGGVDIAVKAKEQNDFFAHVEVGRSPSTGFIYVLESFYAHLLWSKQTAELLRVWRTGADGWFRPGSDPDSRFMDIAIENNAAQDAQVQTLREQDPTIRVVGIQTITDKVTRAHRIQPLFEQRKIKFVGKRKHTKLIDTLVLFPNDMDDLFDALEMAISNALRPRRNRRRRKGPVGVL